MATTAAAIRDAMIALVEDITPATHAADKFHAHLEQADFRDWAQSNPGAALRRFSIRSLGQFEAALVSDTRVEETGDTFEIVVAYAPNGRHGTKFLTDLDDAIESDQVKIHAVIGPPGYASFTAPATVMHSESFAREDGTGVTFSVVRYSVRWYRAVS